MLSRNLGLRLARCRTLSILPSSAHGTGFLSCSTRFFSSKPTYELPEAVRLVQALAKANFDETVEIAISTSLDPRKPDQSIKGVSDVPHGTGKAVRVAVFAEGDKAEDAKDAGADIVGAEDLADKILEGGVNFTRCIATPDMMRHVAKVARILGPRGLMPNPKMGTVTMDIKSGVEAAKKGQLQFKTERQGNILVGLGKVSWEQDKIVENITTFVQDVVSLKPSGAPKGDLITKAVISSTMGEGIAVDVSIPPFKKVQQAPKQA